MQGDSMNNKNVDKLLSEHLPGSAPREAFKEQALRDSTTALIQVQQRRFARRRMELAAAAILVAGLAFLGGRLSAPSASPRSVDDAPQATTESEGITVPSDLVAWLDAARLFNQLGMKDRMSRAVERASRLLPADTFIAYNQTLKGFAAGSIENQTECFEPMGKPSSQSSADSINQILAQSLGD